MNYKHKKNRLGFKLKKGFSLVEAIIVIAATLVLISMIFGFYRLVFAKTDAAIEADAANSLTASITSAYQSSANFFGLNNQTLIQDGLLTSEFRSEGTQIYTPSGFDLVVNGRNDGKNYTLNYMNFGNRNNCVNFVNAITDLNNVKAIYVQGQNLMRSTVNSDGASTGLAINETFVAEACSMEKTPGSSTVDIIVYIEPFSVAGDISDLIQCVVPSPEIEERELSCATGYSGTIKETRKASCPGPYSALHWTDWEEVSNTCNIICVVDPLSPERRTKSCPSGFLGQIVEQRISVCENYNGFPVWRDWEVIENTCAPICTAPTPKIEYKSCAPGYTGRITETTTYSCPAPTGDYQTHGPTITENTCVLQCKSQLPNPNPEVRYVNKTKACPAGYGGVISYKQQQVNLHTCANPEAAGTPVQSGWTDTNTIIDENSSACVNLCAPETLLTQWTSRSSQCPSGYSGTITWEQEQRRTSVCNGGTSPVTSGWTDVAGSIRNRVERCQKICVLPNPSTQKRRADTTEPRYEVCPAGQYGPTQGIHYWRDVYREQTRTAYCPNTLGDYAWTDYGTPVVIGNSDYRLTANHCNSCPANYPINEDQWQNRSSACPAGYTGSITWQQLARRTATMGYNCPAGTTSIPAPVQITNWTPYSDVAGQTRNRVDTCVIACTPRQESKTEYQDINQCLNATRTKFCEPGLRQRNVVIEHTCPSGTRYISEGSWTISRQPVCVKSDQFCP